MWKCTRKKTSKTGSGKNSLNDVDSKSHVAVRREKFQGFNSDRMQIGKKGTLAFNCSTHTIMVVHGNSGGDACTPPSSLGFHHGTHEPKPPDIDSHNANKENDHRGLYVGEDVASDVDDLPDGGDEDIVLETRSPIQ